MGTTLLTVRSTSDLLYGFGLSSALRSQYVYDPSFALFKEPDIWELVRNDLSFHSSISRSSKSIVRPWRIEAWDGSKDKPDRQLAAVIKEGLSFIDRFGARRRRLSEARFLGRTYAAILWQKRTISLGGLPEMEWYIPVHLQDIDRRRIHWVVDWDQHTNQKTGIHREMYNTNTQRWEVLPPELEGSLIEYIVGDTEDRVGNGRGLLEPLYFGSYLKVVILEKLVDGIDHWAKGIWIAKIDGLRGASSAKTNEALRQGAETLLNTMRSEHAAVVEKVDDIQVIQSTGTGHQMCMDAIHYIDEAAERLCNGSVRPSGHNPGGSGARAASETEEDTSEAFFQDEREDGDDILTRDLVGAFRRVNVAQFEKVKLDQARRPRFTSEQIKRQDPEKAVAVMNQALQYVPLSRRQYYEKIECEDPREDEEQIAPVGPQGAGFGGDGAKDNPDWRDYGVKTGKAEEKKPTKAFGYFGRTAKKDE